jgi:hypothetical protein
MNLYSIDIEVVATAYIKANSKAEAIELAKTIQFDDIEVDNAGGCDLISDLKCDDPDLPQVSLSPSMTIHGFLDEEPVVDLVEENIQAGDEA